MPDVEPIDSLLPRIMDMYSDNPAGWRAISTPKGDMIISSPKAAFQLKAISLNPREFTGAGIELADSPSIMKNIEKSPDFGLRPIHMTDLEGLMKSLHNPEDAQAQLRGIINRAPVSTRDLSGNDISHILSGPVFTRPDLHSLSPEISRTQSTLEKSARKIFEEKYPFRAGMYF